MKELSSPIVGDLVGALYNLCRLNKPRQRIAAEAGAIGPLVAICRRDTPVRQLARPIICELAHGDAATRKLLWPHGGPQIYVELLADPYWAAPALEAIAAWCVGGRIRSNLTCSGCSMTRRGWRRFCCSRRPSTRSSTCSARRKHPALKRCSSRCPRFAHTVANRADRPGLARRAAARSDARHATGRRRHARQAYRRSDQGRHAAADAQAAQGSALRHGRSLAGRWTPGRPRAAGARCDQRAGGVRSGCARA